MLSDMEETLVGNLSTDSNISCFVLNCSTNFTAAKENNETISILYHYIVSFLVLFCFTSILLNVWILSSVCWIRRKLSRTLLISLSLAAADVFSSLTLGLGLVVNSLMGTALGIKLDECLALGLEALRLSAIITTVFHLLALAGNHYLGILRPLHYASIMTHRITTMCIGLMWLLPLIFFFSYFSLLDKQGFRTSNCDDSFIRYSKFRFIFATLFFVPFMVMIIIYTHILFIVVRLQGMRQEIYRVGTVTSRHNHQIPYRSTQGGTRDLNNEQVQMARNIKAWCTTMFILGSFVIGWIPALIVFVLLCDDCVYQPNPEPNIRMVFIFSFVNFLVILKTLINPIIYSARMHEIKVALKHMHSKLRRTCCRCIPLANGVMMDASQSDFSRHPTQRTSTSFNRSSTLKVARAQSFPLTQNVTDTPIMSSNGSSEEMKLIYHSDKRSHRRKVREQSAML